MGWEVAAKIGIDVIGGALGLSQASKARKNIKKANALNQQVARLRALAEQRAALRQGQVEAATSLVSSAASGADVASSGYQGVQSSIYTQMIDNFILGEISYEKQFQAGKYTSKAGKQIQNADLISGITGIAGKAFDTVYG